MGFASLRRLALLGKPVLMEFVKIMAVLRESRPENSGTLIKMAPRFIVKKAEILIALLR